MCVCWLLQIWIYVHKYSYIKLAKGQRSTVHFPKTRLPWELFDMNRRAIAARIGAAIARLRNVLSWRAGKRWQWSWWVIWASHVCVWHVSMRAHTHVYAFFYKHVVYVCVAACSTSVWRCLSCFLGVNIRICMQLNCLPRQRRSQTLVQQHTDTHIVTCRLAHSGFCSGFFDSNRTSSCCKAFFDWFLQRT